MKVTVDNASVYVQDDRVEIGVGDCGMTYSTFTSGAARIIGHALLEAADEAEAKR